MDLNGGHGLGGNGTNAFDVGRIAEVGITAKTNSDHAR
jgi:hypothetical protein